MSKMSQTSKTATAAATTASNGSRNRTSDEHNLDKVESSGSSSNGNGGGESHPTRDETFFNHYATKKTVSNGFLDGALLATNVGQLKVLLSDGIINTKDAKWWVSVVLVGTSLLAQVIMFIILGYLASNNLANRRKKSYINFMNDVSLFLTGVVFCLNIITNVFIQIDFSNLSGNKGQAQAPATLSNSMWSTTDQMPFS